MKLCGRGRIPSSGEIKEAWNSVGHVRHLGDVAAALNTVRSSLRKWSMKNFGSVNKELKQIRERMSVIGKNASDDQQAELLHLRTQMDEILYREEMMWLQRSRVAWLKEGDRNTRFFHMKAAGQAKKNKIKRLRKDDGQVTTDKKELEYMTRNFF
jgi:hypothetical protein